MECAADDFVLLQSDQVELKYALLAGRQRPPAGALGALAIEIILAGRSQP